MSPSRYPNKPPHSPPPPTALNRNMLPPAHRLICRSPLPPKPTPHYPTIISIPSPPYNHPTNPKHDLALRPPYPHNTHPNSTPTFTSHPSPTFQLTLPRRLHAPSPRLSPRSALEKSPPAHILDPPPPTPHARVSPLTRHPPPAPRHPPYRPTPPPAAATAPPAQHNPSPPPPPPQPREDQTFSPNPRPTTHPQNNPNRRRRARAISAQDRVERQDRSPTRRRSIRRHRRASPRGQAPPWS